MSQDKQHMEQGLEFHRADCSECKTSKHLHEFHVRPGRYYIECTACGRIKGSNYKHCVTRLWNEYNEPSMIVQMFGREYKFGDEAVKDMREGLKFDRAKNSVPFTFPHDFSSTEILRTPTNERRFMHIDPEYKPAPMKHIDGPDPIVNKGCELMQSRSVLGVKKYGTTLKDNNAPIAERINHIREELMDGVNYCTWVLDQIETQNTTTIPNELIRDIVGLLEIMSTSSALFLDRMNATKTVKKLKDLKK